MAKKETKKDVKKTTKPTPEKEVVEVKEEPKAVEGEVVQAQPVQPVVKQGNGQKWCCCCGIIFVIFILLWILMQFLSFFMPIFPPLMPGF
jgi:hypothetical protein